MEPVAHLTSSEQTNRLLLRARDAIDRDYERPLDIVALARIALCSEAHFIRSFRRVFGETPHRYLQRRRVERAMWLLRATDRSVSEICLDVVGETPSSFRANGRPVAEVPTCFEKAWSRPSSFGQAGPAGSP